MPVAMTNGEELRIALTGAVGVAEARSLSETALTAVATAGVEVVIDLASVETIDTAATQVLLALRAELRADARVPRFVDVPPSVSAAWRLLGVEALLG